MVNTISTNPTITSHLNSLNIKKRGTTTYDIGNPSPGSEQALKCGGVEPVNGITAKNKLTYSIRKHVKGILK